MIQVIMTGGDRSEKKIKLTPLRWSTCIKFGVSHKRQQEVRDDNENQRSIWPREAIRDQAVQAGTRELSRQPKPARGEARGAGTLCRQPIMKTALSPIVFHPEFFCLFCVIPINTPFFPNRFLSRSFFLLLVERSQIFSTRPINKIRRSNPFLADPLG